MKEIKNAFPYILLLLSLVVYTVQGSITSPQSLVVLILTVYCCFNSYQESLEQPDYKAEFEKEMEEMQIMFSKEIMETKKEIAKLKNDYGKATLGNMEPGQHSVASKFKF